MLGSYYLRHHPYFRKLAGNISHFSKQHTLHVVDMSISGGILMLSWISFHSTWCKICEDRRMQVMRLEFHWGGYENKKSRIYVELTQSITHILRDRYVDSWIHVDWLYSIYVTSFMNVKWFIVLDHYTVGSMVICSYPHLVKMSIVNFDFIKTTWFRHFIDKLSWFYILYTLVFYKKTVWKTSRPRIQNPGRP